jgi:hypothetical protein
MPKRSRKWKWGEQARERALLRHLDATPREGDTTCDCGTCRKCRRREWMRKGRAGEKRLGIPLDLCPIWQRHLAAGALTEVYHAELREGLAKMYRTIEFRTIRAHRAA